MEAQLGSIDEFLLGIVRKVNIIDEQEQEVLNSLNKEYPKLAKINKKMFHQAVYLVEDKPDDLITLVKTSLADAMNLSTLLSKHQVLSKTDKSISDKMAVIAVVYELAAFFKLGSYLLAEGKAPIQSFGNPLKILKSFKKVGMTINVEILRKIRNANSHKFAIINNEIIDENNERIISIQEFNELYVNVSSCIDWYVNFLFKIMFYVPKFGIVVTNTIYHEIIENRKKYSDYYKGLKLVAPSFFKTKKKGIKEELKFDKTPFGLAKKLKYKMEEALTFRFTIHLKANRNRKENPLLYKKNIEEISYHVNRQMEIIKTFLHELYLKIQHQDNKARIAKSINLLESKKIKWTHQLKIHGKKIIHDEIPKKQKSTFIQSLFNKFKI